MKKLFIVTLTFNSNKETHDWLASVKKMNHEDVEIEIVIVDNASKEPFVLEKKEQAENIHVMRSKENTGFSGGNNIGMKYALNNGADHIMAVNNDTLLDKDLVNHLVEALENDKTIGIAVPKIYFEKGHEFHKDRYTKEELGKVLWYAGGHTDWSNIMSVHRGVDEVDHGQYNNEEPVTFASGCCMMLKKEVLEKVGLFDEKYFLYFEDADLCERIQQCGYKILYVPTAILWHINAGSTGGSGSVLQDYFMTRNRMLFGMRYAPLRSKIALIRESIRLLGSGRPMQKKGIRDFYLGRFGKGSILEIK